jgi:large subunit ribosomal protein L28
LECRRDGGDEDAGWNGDLSLCDVDLWPVDPATLSLSDHKDWSNTMAAKCDLCGKGPQFGNNISHANNTTRRRWNVNLRPVKAKVEGASKRIRVCTSCIKTGKVVKG